MAFAWPDVFSGCTWQFLTYSKVMIDNVLVLVHMIASAFGCFLAVLLLIWFKTEYAGMDFAAAAKDSIFGPVMSFITCNIYWTWKDLYGKVSD